MLPHQKNKIDLSSLTEEEEKLFRLYGKLPSKKDILSNKLKERKYFDSGDYALSKAGKASDVGVTQIGSKHPLPENIPHSAAAHQHPHTPGSVPGAVGIPGASSVSPGKDSPLATEAANAATMEEGGQGGAHSVGSPDAQLPQGSPPGKKAVPSRWVSQT